jgi:hypothetical protein
MSSQFLIKIKCALCRCLTALDGELMLVVLHRSRSCNASSAQFNATIHQRSLLYATRIRLPLRLCSHMTCNPDISVDRERRGSVLKGECSGFANSCVPRITPFHYFASISMTLSPWLTMLQTLWQRVMPGRRPTTGSLPRMCPRSVRVLCVCVVSLHRLGAQLSCMQRSLSHLT